jgi:hypothetical protein
MKTILLALLLASGLHASADSMRFDCKLYYPAAEQGQERFARVSFPPEGGAKLELADLSSPYQDLGETLKLKRAFYTDDDEMVGAGWVDSQGRPAADLAIAFFGTYWVAHLQFYQDVRTPDLKFSRGEEVVFRCSENPY